MVLEIIFLNEKPFRNKKNFKNKFFKFKINNKIIKFYINCFAFFFQNIIHFYFKNLKKIDKIFSVINSLFF